MAQGSTRPPGPQPGVFPIDHGVLDLRKDLDVAGGWEIRVDDVLSSYIDVDDPTYLDFEYVRWIATVIGAVVGPAETPAALHLGGAGCTLPRWLCATRPGSDNTVIEYDAALVSLLGEAFGIVDGPGLRIVVGEAGAEVAIGTEAAYDLVIRDTFTSSDNGDPQVPEHLRTNGFAARVHRLLRPEGCYIANLTDRPPLGTAWRETATLQKEFRHVCAVTEPGILRGRRYGNVVVAASDSALPLAEISRWVRSDAIPATVVTGERLAELLAGVSRGRRAPSTAARPR